MQHVGVPIYREYAIMGRKTSGKNNYQMLTKQVVGNEDCHENFLRCKILEVVVILSVIADILKKQTKK